MTRITQIDGKYLDLRVENHGTIVLLRPVSDEGEQWLTEHVASEDWQWLGGALACEPRTVPAVVEGAIADGLVVA